MEVRMDVLVQAKIMEESKNNVSEKGYGLVASIKHHIDYRNQERAAKLNANDNKKKRTQINQQGVDESPILDA
eukprot:CAMPEP_0170759160 /NCGR_PEP_ID=MMETSP0733-20121128/751_1 /TAXON_ID=186038 /ORGANISM="Fragilariopsis kerguelensis, Strain L26-C5" /LENGTH=72 /DNA_ID=CAMNT_0011098581 /DNA_START=770 /DNA_END=988 /DNA_ORIENTATION=+